MVEWFKTAAHKHGLNTKQAVSLFNEFGGMAGLDAEKLKPEWRRNRKAIGSFRQEWGQAYDQNDRCRASCCHGVGYDVGKLSAIEDKLGTAEMLRLFATLSKMGEDSFAGESAARGDSEPRRPRRNSRSRTSNSTRVSWTSTSLATRML